MDNDLVRVWHLINELSDQLAHNYKITKTLQSQANLLKVKSDNNFKKFLLTLGKKNEAAQVGSATSNLRRFNTDITKGKLLMFFCKTNE